MEPFLSKSPSETMAFAHSFASSLERNTVVALIGDLGSGKTQFVKGVCQYFQVHELVSSPTFVMLHRYAGRDNENNELLLYHFDLYKVRAVSEILELGYEEFFRGNGICLIEWADKLHDLTPPDRVEINFSLGRGENERLIAIAPSSSTKVRETARNQYVKKFQNEHSRY
jgi:tRNA threonylcarbamoyladenosine biosynthesis protein TsaE